MQLILITLGYIYLTPSFLLSIRTLFLINSIIKNSSSMYLQSSKYQVLSMIGQGSAHVVFKAEHNITQKLFAIKMEKYPNSGQIDGEIKALKELDQIGGIPNLIHHGMTSENKCFLILPLLNCSLRELVKSQQLSLSQTLAIGLSLIETLEKVHQKHFAFGYQTRKYYVTSLAWIYSTYRFWVVSNFRKFKILKNVFIGSLNFASRASHKGESLGYKDDLESLFYVLVYLRNCKLPWSQKPSMGCKNMDIKFIGEMKASIFNTMVLCQKFPLEFSKFMQYIDELKHYQMPDYTYIKELFIKMLQNTSLSPIMDQFLNYSPVQSINQLGSSEKILIRVEQNLPNNNSIETQIQDDIIDVEAKVVHLSDLIGKYTTIQIKSIQTLNIEYDYNSSNLCITK